ncbi:metalloregulator ArsR/SmtB family transcription factor [Candidatus Borrarchaeum sp.]|uniref:ArsR/SmtB family transcription factor n=1 Tax=Candidatus Borrarchaeum sp. TaxID=2846742 RepID=UPI00257E9BED|nr:metalloregulator ArsR/SmtB family transcription factor [Candidatus Borrarchaeum sp.]
MPIESERLERLIDSGECPSKSSEVYAKELKALNDQLDKEVPEKLLQLFNALSDHKRWKIVKLLLNRKLCVCEFTEVLEVTQSTVSHHLSILESAGLIRGFKKGKWTFYEVKKPDHVAKLFKFAEELVNSKVSVLPAI